MLETEKYMHHGKDVSVISQFKGRHREICLCFNECKFFIPGTPENCPIAEANYAFDVGQGIVTPILECPKYEAKYKHALPNTKA